MTPQRALKYTVDRLLTPLFGFLGGLSEVLDDSCRISPAIDLSPHPAAQSATLHDLSNPQHQHPHPSAFISTPDSVSCLKISRVL